MTTTIALIAFAAFGGYFAGAVHFTGKAAADEYDSWCKRMRELALASTVFGTPSIPLEPPTITLRAERLA